METEQRTDAQPHTDPAQPAVVEWGGGPGRGDAGSGGGPVGRYGLPAVARGAGFGCAVVGFALLLAAELLPWVSLRTGASDQDFPTATGGRIGYGLAELSAYTGMFNFGWLVVLAVVATALVLRPPARRVAVAAGLGLVAGQLALLAGITRGVRRVIETRGGLTGATDQMIHSEAGLYCAYLTLALFAAALLLAGGVPARLRRPAGPADEPELAGPADLTVTPVPADPTVRPVPTTDPTMWSRAGADIEVGGKQPDR